MEQVLSLLVGYVAAFVVVVLVVKFELIDWAWSIWDRMFHG